MMRGVCLAPGADLAGFKHAMRALLHEDISPRDIVWGADLFAASPLAAAPPVMLPRLVAEWVGLVVCHRDPQRYALLYQLIWRLHHGEPALAANPADPLVHRLQMLARSIRRDLHKMHAFLRFRPVPGGAERFIAWFEPDHYILQATADFFIDRFRGLTWSILTPDGSLHWNTETLTLGPPGDKAALPPADDFEAGWCAYYESIFNPARLNQTAMRAEMAGKYWRNMPETRAIPALIASAPGRVRDMVAQEAALPRKRNPDRAVAAMWAEVQASKGSTSFL